MNRDNCSKDNWSEEFSSGDYLYDRECQNVTFENMKNWLLQRKYYKIDLVEGHDYLVNDIDEAKKSVIEERNQGDQSRYLLAREMYKNKTLDFDNEIVESWNMHTKIGHGVSSDKISLLLTPDGNSDALSMIKYLYLNYSNKEYRLLDNFIEYVSDKTMKK